MPVQQLDRPVAVYVVNALLLMRLHGNLTPYSRTCPSEAEHWRTPAPFAQPSAQEREVAAPVGHAGETADHRHFQRVGCLENCLKRFSRRISPFLPWCRGTACQSSVCGPSISSESRGWKDPNLDAVAGQHLLQLGRFARLYYLVTIELLAAAVRRDLHLVPVLHHDLATSSNDRCA